MISHLIAHNIMRSAVYRVMWHAPWWAVALLFVGAILWLRRSGWRW